MSPVRMQSAGQSLKKALDAAAIAALAFVTISGVVLRGATNPAVRQLGISPMSFGPLAFGMNKAEWSSLHDSASLLFIVLLLPNLVWGWSSLVWIFRRGERTGSFSRAAIGLLSAATLLAVAISGFRSPQGSPLGVPERAVPLLGEESDAKLSELSLVEAEKKLNIPLVYLRSNLGLPPKVDINEPLGTLLPKNNIPLNAVRSVIFMHRMGRSLPMPSLTPLPSRSPY